MEGVLIFISLIIFSLGSYLLWPSRYNVVTHMAVGGSFISIFVPTMILHVQELYPADIVDIYVKILVIGLISAFPASVLGFMLVKNKRTAFSFDVMNSDEYEKRVIRITSVLLLSSIIGLILSYIGMGFIPMFADDPISAKLFRVQYQAPYKRVAVLFRASFFILGTIMPIACVIWYKTRSTFYFIAVLSAVVLMAFSLQRSGAFGGIVFAFAVIMSFKSRFHFVLMMVLVIGIFITSSFFYYIVGVRTLGPDENYWKIIAAGASDIQDQLQFLVRFQENPVWTYGRTIYGGLIPGHYKWNPSVYTLNVIAPGIDINEVGSGGIRLPLPMWGYVAFEWIGVVLFSSISGFLAGVFLRLLKTWIDQYKSIIIRMTAIVVFATVFGTISGALSSLNMYLIPPIIVMLFYMYRIKWK